MTLKRLTKEATTIWLQNLRSNLTLFRCLAKVKSRILSIGKTMPKKYLLKKKPNS